MIGPMANTLGVQYPRLQAGQMYPSPRRSAVVIGVQEVIDPPSPPSSFNSAVQRSDSWMKRWI